MGAKKVGTLIREARTDAGMTQEQLARKVRGASASDISKAERGEKELTTEQLKAIAKATGVTQKSLLDAAKGSTSSSGKASSGSTMKLTATEKRLVQLYRKASTKEKQAALKLLQGNGAEVLVGNLLDGAIGALTGKK